MRAVELKLRGLLKISFDVYRDDRGSFSERFNAKQFREWDIPVSFSITAHSVSAPGVLRGLHFQRNPMQGKLVTPVQGKIFDVVVDLRKKSPTFGQWHAEELSAEAGDGFWVPPGFAHGYCTLGDRPAEILYNVVEPYSPQSESGIRWDDPDLKIAWPVKSPALSAKDKKLPSFKSLCAE